MTPEEVTKKAAEIPVVPMGWSGTPASFSNTPIIPPTPVVAPKISSGIEKAHEIVKLLSDKQLLKEFTLNQVFDLMEEIRKII